MIEISSRLLLTLQEALGGLEGFPPAWLKMLKGQGKIGENSTLEPIATGIKSTMLGKTLIAAFESGKYGAVFVVSPLKTEDADSQLLITKDPYAARPSYKVTDKNGKTFSYEEREYSRNRRGPDHSWTVQRSALTLGELAAKIGMDSKTTFFGLTVDANRQDLQAKRLASKSKRNTDILDLSQNTAKKFVKDKAQPSIDALKTKISSTIDKVRAKLDGVIAGAETGEYHYDQDFSLSREEYGQLSYMLSDLNELSRQIKDITGIRPQKFHPGNNPKDDDGRPETRKPIGDPNRAENHYDRRPYPYSRFVDKLANIEKRLANLGGGDQYKESIRIKADYLLNNLLKK